MTAAGKELRVLFEPSGRKVFVLPGTVLLEAAAQAGFILHTPCGGAGHCGKCLVRIRSGRCTPSATEEATLGAARIAEGFRLACQARVEGPLTIEIPETSLFQSQQQILTADSGEPLQVHPRVARHPLTLPSPTHGAGEISDAERLLAALPPCRLRIAALRRLPLALRQADFRVTAVVADGEVLDIEPGHDADSAYGVAFDIGSTTLVGTLVHLRTGADLAVAARVNPQTSFGDDVLSRIAKCRNEPDGLAVLQAAVLDGINRLLDELVKKTGVDRRHVYELVFAGNTTMQQIFCGISPAALGELPFVPAFREALEMHAADLGLRVNPEAKVYVFPQIGGFVGGDTVAGIVATRLDRAPTPALLVDIGTNGEIVLAAHGRLTATSVAAGPAFEGARIVNGMRATAGAIEKVLLDGDVRINVIGNARPAGLCGTGLIDAAAELLRVGALDSTGRLLHANEAPAGLEPAIRNRLIEEQGEVKFLLADGAITSSGQPLYLYQRDIRELQLANGAIRAGINILLQDAGLRPEDLGVILLAGAFGNFIRRNHARRIGMLPPIPCRQIRFVGNTASFGAKRVLLSVEEKKYAEEIVRRVEHLDLSLHAAFLEEFGRAMLLPEQDPGECAESD